MTRIDLEIPLKAGEVLHEPAKLDFAPVAAASHLAEQEVLSRLAAGTLADGYPAVAAPLRLGFSVFQSTTPAPPGQPAIVGTWIPRDSPLTDHPVVLAG